MQPLRASKIEKRLVDRQRLDQRRQFKHEGADLAAHVRVFRHVGLDHGRARTQFESLEHRHRGAHAKSPGDVAAGRDHPSARASNDERRRPQRGVVALLNRRVESIAVYMRDRERVTLQMHKAAR